MPSKRDSRSPTPPSSGADLSEPERGSGRDLTGVFSPPPRESLADKVVEQLREAILNGQFAPGEQLRETMLAEFFHVSRGPIREVLTQLEREGLVMMRPNRTAVVARLTRQDFEEVYSLRLALERLAVQYTIRNASPADVDGMQQVVQTMNDRVRDGINEKDAADLDLHFHDLLYQASRHKRLQACWADLRPQIYVFLLSRNVADPDFGVQMVLHQSIVTTLRSGDENQAVQCIEQHIQAAYDRIIKSYST
jgi:DNA-binding GntR family transcriptional regulator